MGGGSSNTRKNLFIYAHYEPEGTRMRPRPKPLSSFVSNFFLFHSGIQVSNNSPPTKASPLEKSLKSDRFLKSKCRRLHIGVQ